MKHEIINLLRSGNNKVDQRLRRKIFIGLGVLGILFVFGVVLIGYLGVKIAGHVISNAPTTEDVGRITQQFGEQGTVVEATRKVASCADVVQSNMAMDAWLNHSVLENLSTMYEACFWSSQEEPSQIEERKGDETNQSNL